MHGVTPCLTRVRVLMRQSTTIQFISHHTTQQSEEKIIAVYLVHLGSTRNRKIGGGQLNVILESMLYFNKPKMAYSRDAFIRD